MCPPSLVCSPANLRWSTSPHVRTMTDARSRAAVRLSTWIAMACGAVSAAIGAMVLWVGWILHNPRATDIIAGAPSMKANTALSLVSAGIALFLASSSWPLAQRLAPLGAVVCALIGGATLVEYVAGVDLRIDQILAADPATASLLGRMAFLTAANLVAIALG